MVVIIPCLETLALVPNVTPRPLRTGGSYPWQLSRISRLSPQTNTSLSCALYPHSCAPGKNFPVGHPPGHSVSAVITPGGSLGSLDCPHKPTLVLPAHFT